MAPSRPALAPHAPLPEFYGQSEARARWVNRIFDESAPHYDRISEWMSLGGGRRYRRNALDRGGLRPGMRVLDVATGTGLVAAAAFALGIPKTDLVGLDPSRGMLGVNRKQRPIALVQGRGETLPFPAASFDFLVMGYALRHVEDLATLFSEFRRVVRPGGRALVLEISRPESALARAAQALYMRRVVPVVTRLLTRRPAPARLMEYYWATIEGCVPPAAILEGLRAADFREVRRTTVHGALNDYLAIAD
jgi:demethylmenaquinone methyltransferase / 2-methoxy-6-polyprenyl-1,4-benzoquinol methylase